MASQLCCYLVEWYRTDLSDEAIGRTLAQLRDGVQAMSTNGSSPKVLMVLSVPADGVMFCVVAATSRERVAEVCDRAGLPAERVTPAVATPFT